MGSELSDMMTEGLHRSRQPPCVIIFTKLLEQPSMPPILTQTGLDLDLDARKVWM